MTSCECSWKQKNVPFFQYDHWAGHDVRKFVLFGLPIITIGLLFLSTVIFETVEKGSIANITINNLDCYSLAEYVADRKTNYSLAEHRYEWLCVNEQVKEFQG